ncbi:MAG: ZIP family metal transporter [Duodenibacillus sp.]|nr:ZIP family metal transporter [Duodenibacillus sp.]
MTDLLIVVAANLISRTAAVALAAFLSFRVLSRHAETVAALACGLLLAVATTHLIPEAIESGLDAHEAGLVLLAALIGFILLERVLEAKSAHTHGMPRVRKIPSLLGGGVRVEADCCGPDSAGVTAILAGAATHNFVDGILVAAAFWADLRAGLVVTLAIFAHEIPQLVGQMVLLTQQGVERRRAGRYCFGAAMFAVLGGIAGGVLFTAVQAVIPYALIVSAASFLYVVLAVLLPETKGVLTLGSLVRTVSAIIAGAVLSMAILSPLHEAAHERAQSEAHAEHGLHHHAIEKTEAGL